MPITKVIFVGKSKKKTGNTKFMFNALKRRVKQATFINVPRHKKLFFWTDFQKIIHKKILRVNPDVVLIYSKDLPYQVLKNIRTLYRTVIFYPDPEGPLNEKLIRYGRLVDYRNTQFHPFGIPGVGLYRPHIRHLSCNKSRAPGSGRSTPLRMTV